jgi:endonuclease-8
MPEGHTIHRLAADLARDLAGRPVVASSPQGRFAESAARLDGGVVDRTEAFGKQLFVDFADGTVLSVHLGLIGKFRRWPIDRPPSAAARLRLHPADDAAAHVWELTGPMVCELVDPQRRERVAAAIGPDPLRRNGSVDEFVRRAATKKAPIGAVLLDQRVVAGIGNVYRAEVCFLCGIDPRRSTATLAEDDLRALWTEAGAQLRLGVTRNRIVTRDLAEVGRRSWSRLTADERLYVYKRTGAPCHRCGDPVRTVDLAGRSAWYCGSCQS